jgi:hypothetical protein
VDQRSHTIGKNDFDLVMVLGGANDTDAELRVAQNLIDAETFDQSITASFRRILAAHEGFEVTVGRLAAAGGG